jgi:alpha-1,2-mannosyltransferase
MMVVLSSAAVSEMSVVSAALLLLTLILRWLFVGVLRGRTRRRFGVNKCSTTVAIYHPFCNSGGGGERVLWKLLRTLGDLHGQGIVNVHIIIFAAAEVHLTREVIMRGSNDRFGINFESQSQGPEIHIDFVFVPLGLSRLLLPEAWPRFTMVGQSLGSVVFAAWALLGATPDT